MRRLVVLVALIVGLQFVMPSPAVADHWPQGWHWLRTQAATGSVSQSNTLVYWQARHGLSAQALPAVKWAASWYDGHPELVVRVVDVCPTGKNCVVWKSGDTGYHGLTGLGVSGNHMYGRAGTVTLDYTVGSAATGQYVSRLIAFHEACHTFGGGGTDWMSDNRAHRMCNWNYRAHTANEITRVYHDDPG